MKKLIAILIILTWSCSTPEIPYPEVAAKDNIFSVPESRVSNGQSIHFDLSSAGVYILTILDKETNQVLSREKFNGKSGENVKKIFTNTLPKKDLILVLQDINKGQLGRTLIINK